MSPPAEDRDPAERHFAQTVEALQAVAQDRSPGGYDPGAPVRPGSALTAGTCLELFDAQLASRHVDVAAR